MAGQLTNTPTPALARERRDCLGDRRRLRPVPFTPLRVRIDSQFRRGRRRVRADGEAPRRRRAVPLFMYGQSYILAVEAWMAAPLFLLAGPSIAALKLPLLAVNLATALLLVHLLERDGGLRPVYALGGEPLLRPRRSWNRRHAPASEWRQRRTVPLYVAALVSASPSSSCSDSSQDSGSSIANSQSTALPRSSCPVRQRED